MNTFQQYKSKTSKVHHLNQWTGGNESKLTVLYDQLKARTFVDTHIVYWGPEEWTFASDFPRNRLRQLRDLLEWNNCCITFVVGTHRTVHGADTSDPLATKYGDDGVTVYELEYHIPRVKLENWPSYFMYLSSFNYLVNRVNDVPGQSDYEMKKFQERETQIIRNKTPTHLWTTMIGEPWYHRIEALDILSEQGLMPYGTVILNPAKTPQSDIKFRHWDQSNRITTSAQQTSVDQYKGWPRQYSTGIIDIVMESTERARFCTEKTYRPVFYGKPMVILGARNANCAFAELIAHWPQDGGIRMEWDQYRLYEDRVKGLCEELHRLQDKWGGRYEALRNHLLNQTDGAKRHLQNLITQQQFIPDIVREFPDVGPFGPVSWNFLPHDHPERDKKSRGYGGMLEYIEALSWHVKQQRADELSEENGEQYDSDQVSWIL